MVRLPCARMRRTDRFKNSIEENETIPPTRLLGIVRCVASDLSNSSHTKPEHNTRINSEYQFVNGLIFEQWIYSYILLVDKIIFICIFLAIFLNNEWNDCVVYSLNASLCMMARLLVRRGRMRTTNGKCSLSRHIPFRRGAQYTQTQQI